MEVEGREEDEPGFFYTFEDIDDNETDSLRERRERKERNFIEMEKLKLSEEHVAKAWRFYRETLGSPVYWCAPMVGASELAFRMMVRKYGADIATTPMISAGGYIQSEHYRQQFTIGPPNEDRPLIVQFWANEGDPLVKAAKMVESKCDAVEINLGCPQQCAKGGHYGAFLMNSPDVLFEMVSMVHSMVDIPVLCKVRVFKSYEKTLAMCLLLQNAGCSLITVHGRTKEQKRSAESLADWDVIRRLKEDLSIPVISNGNIKCYKDIEECLEVTKCDGVMSACALLANPTLYANIPHVDPIDMALEYLEFAKTYKATSPQIRKHVFSILRRPLNQNVAIGNQLLTLTDETLDFNFITSLLEELREIEIKRSMEHGKTHPKDQLAKIIN